MLDRLREGQCNRADYHLLQSRVMTPTNCQHQEDWKHMPIIVADNTCKDALNEKLAQHWASCTGRELHWYYPVDKRKSHEVQDTDLVDHLQGLHLGRTKGRLGRLPLFIGMPVLVSQNFDVEGRIVNGSHGTVKKIQYYISNNGERRLHSCIIELTDLTSPCMPHL